MSAKRHVTRHGGLSHGDSVDLFDDECHTLRAALFEWEATRPDASGQTGHSDASTRWDNGTLGKLVLEHGALWLAAARDLVRALRAAGEKDVSSRLESRADDVRRWLGRLDEAGRGLKPIVLSTDVGYADALMGFKTAFSGLLNDESFTENALRALGDRRGELRTAKYLRKHAPTHPGTPRWYNRTGPLVRAQTAFDRARGFPWAESSTIASEKVAARYDKDLQGR